MLYEDVYFKTLSDRYTNSRMVPFLTHIDGVSVNLFSINPRQKLTPSMVNQQLFFCCFFFLFLFFFFFFVVVVVFNVKLDAINSFPSNTAEERHIYLKMDHIMRKSVFVICEHQRRRSACASTQSDQRLCCSLPG